MERTKGSNEWDLPVILASLNDDLEQDLSISREAFKHPGTKGDASETTWMDLLTKYLPKRYQIETGHIVDSKGVFSQQIDVVIFDRQYSPFIFDFKGQKIIPAESVYAVFEAKQDANKERIEYARKKISSVRRLHRTSLPIPHAGGTYPPKPLPHIIGGILTLESTWNPPLGIALQEVLENNEFDDELLDLGCFAAHGTFELKHGEYFFKENNKPVTYFLFELIARLQSSATVPMIDIRAYSDWLTK